MGEPEQAKTEESADEPIQPVADFIEGVTKEARNQESADDALLDILEKHILKESTANDAVKNATKAIEQLAESRVQRSESEREQEDARTGEN